MRYYLHICLIKTSRLFRILARIENLLSMVLHLSTAISMVPNLAAITKSCVDSNTSPITTILMGAILKMATMAPLGKVP